MRRILSAIISLALVVSLVPINAAWTQTPTVSLTASELSNDGKITVTVSVNTTEAVKALGIGVVYNSDLVEVDESGNDYLHIGDDDIKGISSTGASWSDSCNINKNRKNAESGNKIFFITDTRNTTNGIAKSNFSIQFYFKLKESMPNGAIATFSLANENYESTDLFKISNGEDVVDYPTSNNTASVAIPVTSISLSNVPTSVEKNGVVPAADSVTHTSSPNITTNLTWDNDATAGGKFKASTVYTATLTINPTSGNTFADEPTITGLDGWTQKTVTTNSIVYTKTFAKTADKVLQSIAVTGPTKTDDYVDGDTLDTTGLVVTPTYDTGEGDAYTASEYTLVYSAGENHYGNKLTKGDTTVTVKAKEKEDVTADITISAVAGQTLTADNFTVSKTSADYTGENLASTFTDAITLKGVDGKAAPTATNVTYTPDTMTNAGGYDLKAAITDADPHFKATDNVSLGTVTVNKIASTATFNESPEVMKGKTLDLSTLVDNIPDGSTASYTLKTANGASLSDSTLTAGSTPGQNPVVTITVSAGTNHLATSKDVTITVVDKYTQTLSFADATVTKEYGDAAFINTLTITGKTGVTPLGDVTYTISCTPEGVATINPTTGQVTVAKVGTATIKASAAETENYNAAEKTYTLTVTQKDLSTATVTISGSYTYSGTAQTPDKANVEVKFGSDPALTEGTDYTFTASDNTNAGTATVTVTGKGNYKGTKTGTFTITAKNITPVVTLTLPDGGYTYDGTAKEPTVTVKTAADGDVIPTSEYTVEYSSNTDKGNATVTITDKTGGNYTWSPAATKTFPIAAASIADAEITGLPTSMVYTGSALEPDVTVKLGGKTLTKGTDYTVAYSDDHKDVADSPVTVTVTGKGNYTGTATSKPTFTITPAAYTGTVTITGGTAAGVKKGDNLTATLSPAADSGDTVTYQWMKNGTDIEGAKSENYTLPNNDTTAADDSFTVKVTIDGNHTGTVTSAPVVVGKKTLDTATLGVSGTKAVGETLTAAPASLPDGMTDADYTIEWYRDGTTKLGTGTTYEIAPADQGHSITAKLVAKGNYTGEVTSAAQAIPAGTPTLTVTATAGNAQATVNWSVEANGATITQYTVVCKDGSTVIETVTVNASTKSHTFTGLTNGTEYTFKVTAIYSGGTTDSAEVKATPKAPSTPSNPTTPTTPSSTDSTIGGGGGGYTPRDRDTDSSTTTNKNTTTNADGSITTTVKNSDGSVTETTRATDGSTTTTKTEKTGEATTTEKAADGSTGTTKTDAAGNTVAASATVSQQAVRNAARYGSAVKVPVSVKASNSAASAAAVDIALPESSEPVAVEIPVENVSAGTVAVIVHPDGTEEIVKTSTVGKDGVVLTLDGSAKVKIVDNSKYFADVPSYEWYADNVAWASSREIMNGTGDFAFAPNDPTSRSMVAQLLFNLDGAAAPDEITTLFADVNPSDWYANSVTWAVSSGIARGMGDNLFGADQVVTREQFAVMMYNYAQLKGYDVSTSSSLASFPDADGVSDWAADAMAWAVGVGLINGTTDANGNTVLNAQGTATRAQVAAIMQRFCEKVAK